MAYDEKLAGRIRRALAERSDVEEKAMFGGLAFMVRGHMSCGLVGDRLMVRVDPALYDRMLGEPGAKPMDFTGRPMRGFLYVSPAAIVRAPALRKWIARGIDFAESLPPKKKSVRPKSRTGLRRKRAGRSP